MLATESDEADFPDEVAERLRKAVQAAATQDSHAVEDVRAAVREFTRMLRDKGETPEGVLISIRAILGSRIFLDNGQVSAEVTGHKLRELISTWCIKEYFRENSSGTE